MFPSGLAALLIILGQLAPAWGNDGNFIGYALHPFKT
jgi:hypothetical protein